MQLCNNQKPFIVPFLEVAYDKLVDKWWINYDSH